MRSEGGDATETNAREYSDSVADVATSSSGVRCEPAKDLDVGMEEFADLAHEVDFAGVRTYEFNKKLEKMASEMGTAGRMKLGEVIREVALKILEKQAKDSKLFNESPSDVAEREQKLRDLAEIALRALDKGAKADREAQDRTKYREIRLEILMPKFDEDGRIPLR